MFCAKCGCENDADARFCEDCGKPMGAFSAPSSVTVAPPLNRNPFADTNSAYSSSFLNQQVSSRNSNIAGLLSFFLGPLGVHDFYCGKTKDGVMKLIFSITGILSIVALIWNLVNLYNIGDGTYEDGDGFALKPAPWAKWIVILDIVSCILMVVLLVSLLASLF